MRPSRMERKNHLDINVSFGMLMRRGATSVMGRGQKNGQMGRKRWDS